MRPASLMIVTLLTVFLAAPAHAADPKIGYVDVARALNQVEDGKTAKAKLKGDFDGKQKKLDKMQNGLKAKKEDFEKKRAMMKPEVRMQKQEELQREFLNLQQTYVQLQQELMASENKVTQEIAAKMRKVIARIGDRDAYLLIIDIGETVLYYKRHMDVTDQVVKEYNKQYGKK
jgi:outer membrane protein